MIKYPGSKLGLFAAGAFEKAVIHDKSINAVAVCERFNGIRHLPGQESRKAEPVSLRVAQKAVKGIL